MWRPNKDFLEHDRRRQTELRMVELRDTLEEHGCSEAKIEQCVKQACKEAELEAAGGGVGGATPHPGEVEHDCTHSTNLPNTSAPIQPVSPIPSELRRGTSRPCKSTLPRAAPPDSPSHPNF
ncbi:pre-mRNA-splicing factor CWC21-like [Hordeum vulgare]|nr:pre-mRNA-splicing factor CWC21-like [Hordeum vulgare]